MMKVKAFQCNPLQENCFVASHGGEAVVIDCGAYFDSERKAVVQYIKEEELTLRHVLCTHGHLDHIFGVDTLWQEFGVSPQIHPADLPLYNNMEEQTRQFMGIGYGRTLPKADGTLTDGTLIAFGEQQLRVLHTPGHSPGGVCLYCEAEKIVFTGDTLFRMSVGRTDLEGGSWPQLMHSLQTVVAQLPADTVVLPGHGPQSLIGEEKRMNPYLNNL
ncbi:MAG: MBL fold metallo-hydrolase [Prevotella sp.]|nr:MBL fold metallo-hydrolase [Prevotella sp.]